MLEAEELSASEIGWPQLTLDRILDDPDGHGPSRHWRNPLGEPLYDKERVRVARLRSGAAGSRKLSDADVERWNFAFQPTCAPVFTLRFHALAERYLPGVAHKLWSERLTHRVAGRFPGSEERELALIEQGLVAIVSAADGVPLETWAEARQCLRVRAKGASARMGSPWPHVTLRRAYRSSYVSRATGPRALARAVDALALLETAVVTPARERHEGQTLPQLLASYPVLRFDPIIIRPAASRQESLQ